MTSNSIYFKNVLCDNEKRYRIHTVWNDNDFILTVIEDFKTYKSNISHAALKRLAKKYDEDFTTYVEELRNSLSKDLKNITFTKNGNTFTVSRKQDSITVQFADFTLKEVNFNDAAINIMDEINTSSQFYQNEAIKSKKEMKAAIEEKDKYVEKLEEFVNKKKDMEHEIYSKFILILNEKKSRIQYLQELLEKLKRGKADEVVEEFEVNGTRAEAISNSDSDTSIDEPVEKFVHKAQVENNEKPAKKKLQFFDEDDSVTVKSLPKRIKTVASPVPAENITEVIESITTDDNVVSATNKEITKNPEIVVETDEIKKNDSQDSLNFNTQDLFDRL